MTSAAPTILALETDSAWVVILAVSLVTTPAVLLLRRLIGRPGGVASGFLLTLPLLLPLVAAFIYEQAVLPEVAVLQPVTGAFQGGTDNLLHLLLVSDGGGRLVTPYVLTGSAGPWLLIIGLSVVSFMLLRRMLGLLLMRRMVSRCRPLNESDRAAEIREAVAHLARSAHLKRVPDVLILPTGIPGAFVVGSGGGRILVGKDLLRELDTQELAAILGHEVAHLEARDVQVVFVAGLLRDLVAWNPIAHLAFRRLTSDRELEADRRAVAMTGDPLALASGLLKVFGLLKGVRRLRYRAALSFLRPGGRVTRRVSRLIALADGPPSRITSINWVPYAVAACLVAGLGLLAAERMVGDRPAAIAIVLGSPSAADGLVWSPDAGPKKMLGASAAKAERRGGSTKARGTEAERPRAKGSADRTSGTYVVRARDLARWSKSITALARRRGVPLQQDWSAIRVFPQAGSIGVYRMEPKTLFGDPAPRQESRASGQGE